MLLMNDITKITIIFAAILVVLMIVLIVVTVKVLKGGNSDGEEEEVSESVKRALKDESEDDDEEEDDDELEDDDQDEDDDQEDDDEESEEAEKPEEPDEKSAKNIKEKKIRKAVEEEPPVQETISLDETQEEIEEESDEDDEDDSVDEPTADISEAQAAAKKYDEEYVSEDTQVMDDVVDRLNDEIDDDDLDSEYADSAFAPQSVADRFAASVAKADRKKRAEYESRKGIKNSEKTEDKVIINNVAEPYDEEDEEETTAENLSSDESEASDKAEAGAVADDSAFSDSAFGEQPEYAEEENIHPLPVTGNTIPINPVNVVNISTVNSVDTVNTKNESAGINDMNEVKDFLEENPKPKKKKKKIKKSEREFEKKFGFEPEFGRGKYYWYNNQDIENLTKKEDMYFYCHYFDTPEDTVNSLIVEMYDCAFVRTEEIQYIAYGVRFKSMNFRTIINTKEHIDFDKDEATKTPTSNDMDVIYEKWCGYVDKFMEIIVFNAPDSIKDEIIESLYEYGRNDVDTLMVSPE
ncbi:MAG: hypothetical protein K6C35_07675 [Eubacterium sp.]|nr:hypothetical protein [Eubacterium sp.]